MNHILVPINLRSDYENLLQYATSVSQKSKAKLVLFYAGGRTVLKGSGNFCYDSQKDPIRFYQRVRHPHLRNSIREICERLMEKEIEFSFKFVSGRSSTSVVKETKKYPYDLLIMATHSRPGIRGYLHEAWANRIIGEVQSPVFVVPATSTYNEIQHITYAVDLTDYDPNIIKQVKTIAGLFDAKLSITHVNREEETQKEQYLQSLEKTITDTLDYPKVQYKFFDHTDPFGGLVKFVDIYNSNLVAMINRKKFSWKTFFTDKSLTRRMSHQASVPLLAFNKH